MLVFSISLTYLKVNAQPGFEIRTNSKDTDDNFVNICCDSSGNLYCSYYKELDIRYNKLIESFLYKISPTGDTTFFDYSLSDTILMLPIVYLDSDRNILLGGFGWHFDSINGETGKFQYFLKMDLDLNILWRKKFLLELNADSCLSIQGDLIENPAGNYTYAVTNLIEPPPYSVQTYLFEFSKEGDSLNYRLLEGDDYGAVYNFTTMQNPDKLFLHMARRPLPPSGDISVCKKMELSENLETISIDSYPGRYFEPPFYTMKYNESSFISFGTLWEINSDDKETDYYLNARILDSSLNIISEVSLTDPQRKAYAAWTRGIDYHYPNRIYVVGMDNLIADISQPDIPDCLYVGCLDENLNIIHEEYIENDNEFYLINSICATPDGGVAIAGAVYNFDYQNYKYDAYILKLDSSQFVGVNDIILPDKLNYVFINPNPAKDRVNIHSDYIPYSLAIFDISGKQLINKIMHQRDAQIDISHFPSGIFFWRAENNELRDQGILIKH
jgi:hypothetical protein